MKKQIQTKSFLKNYEEINGIKRQKNLYSWVTKFCENRKVLHLCCGNGYGTNILSKKASKVDGIDKDSNLIRFAFRNFFKENKTRYLNCELFEYLKSCQEYDLTVFFDIQNKGITSENLKNVLDLIPSHELVLGYSNDVSFNSSILLILNQDGYDYEMFYEHEDKIDNSNKNVIGCVLFIKNIKIKKNTIIEDKPKVSIIIPAYNSAPTIEETIESALSQTYPNIEIIIIDDGSTDNTSEICKKYGSKLRYFYKSNGGIASALNRGIKEMSGVWFKWLSSDDALTEDAVESLISLADKTGGQIIYSDYDIIGEKSEFIVTHKEPILDDYYLFASKIWIDFFATGGSTLIHKSCFDNVGLFNEDMRFGEDYDWWLKSSLVHGYRFFHLKKSIYKYRIHSRQLTQKVREKNKENNMLVRKRIEKMIKNSDPAWWKTLSEKRKIHNRVEMKTRIRHFFRNIMVKILPKSSSEKIVDMYLSRK